MTPLEDTILNKVLDQAIYANLKLKFFNANQNYDRPDYTKEYTTGSPTTNTKSGHKAERRPHPESIILDYATGNC